MKKKVISVTLAAMMTLGAVPAYASIADENVVWEADLNTETGEMTVLTDNTTPTPVYTALPNNAIRVVVDNKELSATGVSIDGRTLIPLRALGEALGAKVDWNAAKQEIRIEKMLYQADSRGVVTESNRIIIMNVGSKQILKNGTGQELDVAPQIINGSTMVPVRAVTDFLEATVSWDEASRTVTVQSSPADSSAGALKEQQDLQIGMGGAIANRLEEINRQAEIEAEQYKAENRPKGDMAAWGYTVGEIYMTKNPESPGYGLKFNFYENSPYKDEETDVNAETFRLSVVNKETRKEEYTTDFAYSELKKSGSFKGLEIPAQYLDGDKYKYEFSVVVK